MMNFIELAFSAFVFKFHGSVAADGVNKEKKFSNIGDASHYSLNQ